MSAWSLDPLASTRRAAERLERIAQRIGYETALGAEDVHAALLTLAKWHEQSEAVYLLQRYIVPLASHTHTPAAVVADMVVGLYSLKSGS